MLSASAPASVTASPVTAVLAPLPYCLAFAVGGRANGQYDAIPADAAPAPAAAATSDEALTPFSEPIDIPTAGRPSLAKPLPHKDADDADDPTSRGKQLSYDASTAAKEHDSHMHDALHPTALAASAALPALSEASSFGQDSYFVYSRPGAAVHAMGVADGVGGWRSQGVDSGVISRAMMDKCREQARRWDTDSTTASVRNDRTQPSAHASAAVPPSLPAAVHSSPLSSEWMLPFSLPARLITGAYESIKEEGAVKAGSTTACVLTLTAHRCMPSHGGANAATRLSSSASSSPNRSPNRSAPTSPPSSPILVAASAESRHQLSLDDEKSEEKHELLTDELVSQPAADDVDVPLSGATSDSDEEGEDQRMNEAAEQMHAASEQVPGVTISAASTTRTAASLPQKTTSAFWSAVGHLIDHSHPPAASAAAVNSGMVNTTSTTRATAPPASSTAPAVFSPPPSRPPSPSSPPLYLSCASIGDSGFVLLRHGRVIHRSDLQRTGRIVKQLAVIPPHLQGPVHRFCDDRPSDSALSCHRTQPGDLLIVASDGLLDNLTAAGGAGFRQAGFVPWARFFLTGGALDDDSDREAIEAQNRRLEGLVKECEIDWQGTGDRAVADSDGGVKAAGTGAEGFVRMLCDRLVSEATEFMGTLDGKPDDISVLVAQVCRV